MRRWNLKLKWLYSICFGVIAYESRKLNDKERELHVYEQEMISMLHAIKKWYHYLYGSHFYVRSNHRVLKYFLTQPNLSPKQRRRVATLQNYDFEITYAKGKENVVVDALSCMWACSLYVISKVHKDWIMEIQEGYFLDEEVSQMVQKL